MVNMSNKEIVDSRDIDQLNNLIGQAEERIKLLQQGQRIKFWFVDRYGTTLFGSPEYSKAVDFLFDYLKSDESLKENEIGIKYLYIWPSQIDEYMP